MRAKAALLGHKRLGRLKLPENIHAEKDEGYDGHLKWDNDSPEVIATMAVFREAVMDRDHEGVSSTLEQLGAAATEAQLEHITNLLLEGDVEQTKEALLSAICIGSRPLTEFILCLYEDKPEDERCGCANSHAFPPHMTPLVLACINNNFALVECLLLRGHSIAPPHHKNCNCDLCLRQPYSALASVQKVDIFRALCSDAYLWLGTDDPFAAACTLAADLDRFILEDNLEFTEWYRALQQAVQQFATRLANQNWSEQELDLFLAHKCHSMVSSCEVPYPRVQLALESGMKDFIASTNVQRAMDEIWWRGWGNFGVIFKRDVFRILRHGFFYPILAIVYLVTNGKLASSFDVPLARYISNLASYITFIATMIAVRWFRGHPNTGTLATRWTLEAYAYTYVLGMLAERYLMFSRQGFRTYFQFWWRWFDFLLLGCFMLAMYIWICRLAVPYDRQLFYVHRIHVEPTDYGLMYDICLSTGCILAIWKIFYFFQLNKGVGASIISVGRCVGHVYNYLVIMAVIVFSFAVGLNMLIQPYTGLSQDNRENIFSSLESSLRSLYWSLYGYMELNSFPVVAGTGGPNFEEQQHKLTHAATEVLLAVYHVIVVITLLNLMVSLLVKKAEEVLDNEEMEFKYTRVVIYSEFLHWSSAIPPPFNLLLLIKGTLQRLCSKNHKKCWPEIFLERDVVDRPDDESNCTAYTSLMRKAFLRFRASKEYHYKSVFRTDYTTKERPTFSQPKVAFMSDSVGEEETKKLDRMMYKLWNMQRNDESNSSTAEPRRENISNDHSQEPSADGRANSRNSQEPREQNSASAL